MNEREPDPLPAAGRLIAVDYGTVRIGLAVCDPDRILASPHSVRPAKDWRREAAEYVALAKEERAVGWVVGLPIHLDGNESDSSRAARKFAGWLEDQTELPVKLFDERFTSVEATGRLSGANLSRGKTKKRLDAVAATILLESYLESRRRT